jgi:uncharacterized membrane protein YbaN (DUF454 family)
MECENVTKKMTLRFWMLQEDTYTQFVIASQKAPACGKNAKIVLISCIRRSVSVK